MFLLFRRGPGEHFFINICLFFFLRICVNGIPVKYGEKVLLQNGFRLLIGNLSLYFFNTLSFIIENLKYFF